MNADDKFQELWRSKKSVPAISSQDLIKKVGQVKNKLRSKIVFTTLVLIGVLLYIDIFVFQQHPPKLVTSYIGAVLLNIAIIVQTAAYAGFLKLLFENASTDAPIHDYLQHMMQVRDRRRFMQKTILNIYYVCLIIGIGLIFIEALQNVSNPGIRIALPVGAACYMGIMWFTARKNEIKKSEKDLGAVIEKLQAIVEDTKHA
ncbi:hypothetical protein CLV59_11042 [Chitinophaga dinghuensis]|uniref:Uncharacterized protein n=1 Tax=Chitinophaga dinghuensis TaxID=1539050 RepID=A0A327VMJ9_9BACT|nr:hypothetical protein [Chitinophaga dinghuensis]RAJ74996.1 hypothetical protein CLV59_11042 [Chitinophaga dinghuensis]